MDKKTIYFPMTREEMENKICKMMMERLGPEEIDKFSLCKTYIEKHRDNIHKNVLKKVWEI